MPLSIDGQLVVVPVYPDLRVQSLHSPETESGVIVAREPDLSITTRAGTIGHLAAWRLVGDEMRRTGFRGPMAIAFTDFMSLVESEFYSRLSVDEVALWLSSKYVVPRVDFDCVDQSRLWFASRETFDDCFRSLDHGACKQVYRGKFNLGIVLCTALSESFDADVVREHAKLKKLEALGLCVPVVSSLFEVPLPSDLRRNKPHESLRLSGHGFLQRFIQGEHLKPFVGVSWSRNLEYSMNKTIRESAFVMAAQSVGVWAQVAKLKILLSDLRRLRSVNQANHLILVDLQGFVCADGHFVINDPSSGKVEKNPRDIDHRKKLDMLIAVVEDRLRELGPRTPSESVGGPVAMATAMNATAAPLARTNVPTTGGRIVTTNATARSGVPSAVSNTSRLPTGRVTTTSRTSARPGGSSTPSRSGREMKEKPGAKL
ncbi:hypothetical protein [Paraburkholderia humisilvae]|uniref:Uncharacterized protein n=1 Tax=Paraburkholderia humisilvae TaxID=627669 RepID=A0A6J5F7P9_9BURK|nr:hypothetical protein [Paraburkholderia humisilvae]CAB3773642.1 hypothetical protein LMG29542_07359 [Paraburkholderia humisilvae]